MFPPQLREGGHRDQTSSENLSPWREGKVLGLVVLTIARSRDFAPSRLPASEGRHAWGGAAPGGQPGAGGGST